VVGNQTCITVRRCNLHLYEPVEEYRAERVAFRRMASYHQINESASRSF
jgi:hypothetical protein